MTTSHRPTTFRHMKLPVNGVLLHMLGHRQAFVMGHDMGAPVALLYAAHHPDEARGLRHPCGPNAGRRRHRTFTSPRCRALP